MNGGSKTAVVVVLLFMGITLAGLFLFRNQPRGTVRGTERAPAQIAKEGAQTHTRKLPTGDDLINVTRFTQGWQDGMYTGSTLAIRWRGTGEIEPISNSSQLLPNVQHCVIATNQHQIVVVAGGYVYSRARNGPKGVWHLWKLTGSTETFAFIKEHLNRHFPSAYQSGVFKGGGFLKVDGDIGQNEYPLTIHEKGTAGLEPNVYNDLKFPYEVEAIDLEKGELIAVPFPHNHRLPRLVFQAGESPGQWVFSLERSKNATASSGEKDC